MKNIIKFILFIIIFIILWNIAFQPLWMEKNNINLIYEEPKNSIDVLYVGASNGNRNFNTVLAYHLYGFTSFNLSTDGEPFVATENLIKEIRKYQNPKLYIIDLTLITREKNGDGEIRKVADAMKFSSNRFDTINVMLPTSTHEITRKDYLDFYFSFFLYHNSWKTITEDKFKMKNNYKGYNFYDYAINSTEVSLVDWHNEKNDIPEKNKESFLSLIQYIKENQLKVLFLIPRRGFSKEAIGILNKTKDIIDENHFSLLNLNFIENLNITEKTDFNDGSHLNFYGSTKSTLFLSNYIKNNYYVPDHRKENNEISKSWENEYIKMKDKYQKLTKKDLGNLLLEYQELIFKS